MDYTIRTVSQSGLSGKTVAMEVGKDIREKFLPVRMQKG